MHQQQLKTRARSQALDSFFALKAPLFTWSVESDSCYNVPRCMKQSLWSSADRAFTQVRPRQIFTHSFSKNSHSLEPCGGRRSQSLMRIDDGPSGVEKGRGLSPAPHLFLWCGRELWALHLDCFVKYYNLKYNLFQIARLNFQHSLSIQNNMINTV